MNSLSIFEIVFYWVLGIAAYLLFLIFFIDNPWMNLMNKGEYNHFHGYDDYMDEINERFDKMADDTFLELIKDHDMVAEAVGELAYEEVYIEKLLGQIEAGDHNEIGRSFLYELEKYLRGVADEKTTDRT